MPLTPSDLLAEAAKLRSEARRIRETAELEASGREAQAAGLEDYARSLKVGRLTVKRAPPTVQRVTPEQSQAISKSLMGEDANMKAARAAKLPSLRKLASAMGVSASFLSQIRAGTRPMPEKQRAKFRELTGKDWR